MDSKKRKAVDIKSSHKSSRPSPRKVQKTGSNPIKQKPSKTPDKINKKPVTGQKLIHASLKGIPATKGAVKTIKAGYVDKNDIMHISNTIKLKKFDMSTINTAKDGKRVLIIGQSGSGKSTIVLELMKYNKHIPVWVIVSPSEGRNHTYTKHVHPGCVHDDLEIEALKRFRERQESRCEQWEIPDSDPKQYRRDPSAGIVLDDVNISARLFKDDIFRWAYYNSRHDKVLWIQLTQYFRLVPIDHRRNLSHLFIFRQRGNKEIQKIYDEFAGAFDNVADFRKALSFCTENFGCLVINALCQSPNISENIFWYKAPLKQEAFKVGSDWWRKQLDKLYDPNWKENEKKRKAEAIEEPAPKRGGKKKKQVVDENIIELMEE